MGFSSIMNLLYLALVAQGIVAAFHRKTRFANFWGSPNPGCGGAGDAAGSRHLDIAAEAYDVLEVQFLGQQPVEILIAEASIGDDADADPRRNDLGQADQRAAFVEAAAVLEFGLVYRQPDQRRGAAVLGDQGKHD